MASLVSPVSARGAAKGLASRSGRRGPAPSGTVQPVAPARAMRLMIEEAGDAGDFVYKLIDARSGEVVTEIPRRQIERLGEMDTYASGALVDTQA